LIISFPSPLASFYATYFLWYIIPYCFIFFAGAPIHLCCCWGRCLPSFFRSLFPFKLGLIFLGARDRFPVLLKLYSYLLLGSVFRCTSARIAGPWFFLFFAGSFFPQRLAVSSLTDLSFFFSLPSFLLLRDRIFFCTPLVSDAPGFSKPSPPRYLLVPA